MDNLPTNVSIAAACDWLRTKTGKSWTLPNLIEQNLQVFFWLDYSPAHPELHGDRTEGYMARMAFQGDLSRLAADPDDALVAMFYDHDNRLIRLQPGLHVKLSELRFKRDDLQELATATTQPPAPTVLERQEARWKARWQTCINAGLVMPTDTYGPYPHGIVEVAKSLGIKRQSLTDDLNKYRERMFGN